MQRVNDNEHCHTKNRSHYGCVSVNEYDSSWPRFLVAFLVLQRRYYRSVSPPSSLSLSLPLARLSLLIALIKSFSQSLSLLLFALVHHHRCRRMTINNSKTDLPPPSLVPSFNHHCFVSFGSTVASPVDRTPAAVCSMRRPTHCCRCLY